MVEMSPVRKKGAKAGGNLVLDFLEYLTTISDKAPKYDVTEDVLDYFMSQVFTKYHLTKSGELQPKSKDGDQYNFSLRDAYMVVYPWYKKLPEKRQRDFILGFIALWNTSGMWELRTNKEPGNCSYKWGNELVKEIADSMFDYVAEVIHKGWLLVCTFDFMTKTYTKVLRNGKEW